MLATLLISTALLGAAAPQAPAPATEPLKLTGCVSQKAGTGGDYTFTSDGQGNFRYRLTGKDIRKYAGKKVEVVEAESKGGLVIKGGLYPSPNVAGQAGALDPVQAAIATQPGAAATSGTGSEFPEFRAGRIRTVTGACQ